MEQRYSLPVRNSPSLRTDQPWQTPTYPNFAVVSPQQHQYFQSQPPPLTFQSSPGGAVRYAQYHLQSSPPALPTKGHAIYPLIAPFPATLSPPTIHSHNNAQLLPAPVQILRSQDSSFPAQCLACGQKNCQLSSHLHFSRRALKKVQPNTEQSDLTPRPAKAVPFSMQLAAPAMVQESERDHLMSLWSKEWSPTRLGPERHLFPFNYIDRLLPSAKRHGPLLQAVLAYSGTLWSSANNMLGDLAARQQTVAVEVLSQACPSEQEASTDEAMMAATLLLLVYMQQGNDFEVSKHIAGLEHLVKLRGGVYYLGLGGVLAETLLHADHMQAIFFNQSPVWRVVMPALDDIGLPPRLGNGFRRTQDENSLDTQTLLAARSVSKVADVLDSATGVGIPRKVQYAFGYLSMMATYQLAECNAMYHASSNVNECVCLALILFNHVILCNDGSLSPSISRIEYRFWTALHEAEQKGLLLGVLPCLYMWMVVMGLTATVRRDTSYLGLGVEKLRAARIPAGIQRWEQFKSSVLDDFVWLEIAQEETFKRIWKEVEGAPGPRTNGQ